MKYLILIYSNEASRRLWAELDDEQRRALGRGHEEMRELLEESGELVISEGLAEPALAKRVTAPDRRTVATDGPFAEVKEYVAGFYVVDCVTTDRAVEIAARMPDAAWGEVEVRPILDRSAFDF